MKKSLRFVGDLFRPLPLVVVLWAMWHASGNIMPTMSVGGIAVFVLAVLGFSYEVMRSADISMGAFRKAQAFTIFNLLLVSSVLTWMITNSNFPSCADWLILLIVLIGAWVGIANTFRIALRSVNAQVNQG